jgi:hypothetical protein
MRFCAFASMQTKTQLQVLTFHISEAFYDLHTQLIKLDFFAGLHSLCVRLLASKHSSRSHLADYRLSLLLAIDPVTR